MAVVRPGDDHREQAARGIVESHLGIPVEVNDDRVAPGCLNLSDFNASPRAPVVVHWGPVGLCCLVRLAVAEGFEPSRALALHAFEVRWPPPRLVHEQPFTREVRRRGPGRTLPNERE